MFRLLEWFFYDVLHFTHHASKACPHMKGRLSELSDGSAKGIMRWYTERHVAGCPGCRSTLDGLRLLRDRLLRLGAKDSGSDPSTGTGTSPTDGIDEKLTLTPDRWQAVTKSWEQTDEKIAADSE